MLGRTMHGIAYDPIHDEIFVPQPFAQAVLVFRGAVSGEEAPIRVIQGPLTSLANPSKLGIDPIHNELFVPEGGFVRVFSASANGNVAPLRVLNMPKGQRVDQVAVDNINNVLITSHDYDKQPSLHFYNRTDEGDAKVLRQVSGPKTLLTGTFGMRTYPPKGWIVVAMNGSESVGPQAESFVGVWSVLHDDGDVPPRWTIGGPNGALKQPRGVDLDFKNKSVLVSDKVLNAVLTFYFPEMF